MIDQSDLDQEDLLRQTIMALGEKLSREELKLADYLRLLQFRDEADDENRVIRVKAGWVRECQTENRRTDG